MKQRKRIYYNAQQRAVIGWYPNDSSSDIIRRPMIVTKSGRMDYFLSKITGPGPSSARTSSGL
jgi:hypothetical protein